MTEPEIKYCPFCHYDDSDNFLMVIELDGRFKVSCDYCGAQGPTGTDKSAAIQEWNSWREDPRKGE